MIPAYNCSAYLKEAIVSVLAQDMGTAVMQIEVVDDASTDIEVAALVASLGAGRVQYFRQPVNVGSVRNFETCINRARGHFVHLLHGDDRVLPGFYEKITELFTLSPEAGAVFTHYASINEAGEQLDVPPLEAATAGILTDWLPRIALYQRTQYAAMVVRREAYEKLGSFYGTNYGEDWEMWVRIARYYPVGYVPEVLAEYRRQPDSITSEKARTGLLIPDLMQVILRIQQHLPPAERKSIFAQTRKHHAYSNITEAYRLLQQYKDWSLARWQMRQSLRLSQHPSVYYELSKFYLKFYLNKLGINLSKF
ncbi:glycosyltransferase family 2 protein [Hymenobacter telluris]|nr:glycosyltransferase family A protein [Hymenobacter telluris]